MHVDLNADVGELADPAADATLLPWLTSANIACGMHAGTPDLMRRTLRLAAQCGVAAGAHPGFPDREGFGRRAVSITAAEVAVLVRDQVATLAALAAAEGVRLHHVKPHGALYHLASADAAVADAVVRGARDAGGPLAVVGPPASALLAAAVRAGLRGVAEGFPDRAYAPNGSLVPRTAAGALVTDAVLVAARALGMVRDGQVAAQDGTVLGLQVETLCLHGDSPGAAASARAVRETLAAAGVLVTSA